MTPAYNNIYLYFASDSFSAEREKKFLARYMAATLRGQHFAQTCEYMNLNNYSSSRNTIIISKTFRTLFEKPFEFVYCLN